MYQEIMTERRVRRRLRELYGPRGVEQLDPLENDRCWRARLTDGGLAYATVEEDGSITIEEREVVC